MAGPGSFMRRHSSGARVHFGRALHGGGQNSSSPERLAAGLASADRLRDVPKSFRASTRSLGAIWSPFSSGAPADRAPEPEPKPFVTMEEAGNRMSQTRPSMDVGSEAWLNRITTNKANMDSINMLPVAGQGQFDPEVMKRDKRQASQAQGSVRACVSATGRVRCSVSKQCRAKRRSARHDPRNPP